MLGGVVFKKFDTLGTCPLPVIFISAQMYQFLYDGKELPMCIVDGINSDVKAFVPFSFFRHDVPLSKGRYPMKTAWEISDLKDSFVNMICR